MPGLLRRFISKSVHKWVESAQTDGEYARRFNRVAPLRRSTSVRLSYDGARRLFCVDDGVERVWVSRRSRLRYQLPGITVRRQQLMRQYLIPEGLVRSGDFVVDCGANIGEFSLACAAQGAIVLAIEPDPREFASLAANAERVSNLMPLNCALWNAPGTLPFYEKNDTGDSSLFDPGEAESVIEVETCRLDSIQVLPAPPQRIRLLKIEAEGAEPEVLEGCGDLLARTDYVGADLGPERGLAKLNTVSTVVEFMHQRDFRMVDFTPDRCATLFASRSLDANDGTPLPTTVSQGCSGSVTGA